MTVSPIHTGTINGKPVRFFKTPMNDGRPDFPWHATEDLMLALNVPRVLRRQFLRGARQKWGEVHRTIATRDGLVTIAPHFAAQGLVGGTIAVGRAPAKADIEYASEVAKASKALTGDLGMEATLDYMVAAFHRWNDQRPDGGPGRAA